MIQTHSESNILCKTLRSGRGAVGGGCVAMTQWPLMARIGAAGLLVAICLPPAMAQAPAATPEPVTVFTSHPRLFLRPARLRLLRRERERTSARWQQFDAYVAGGAPMPETGFAQALYYQISGDAAAGRRAVAWALGPGTDLRQLALVFDWCQDLLGENDRQALAARISQAMVQTAADETIPAVRSRVLAAIALFDHVERLPNQELDRVVHNWWQGRITPAIKAGMPVIRRDDAYALWEMLHAIRDSTNVDLRESAPGFFREFPIEHLMSYYPAAFRGEDNDYRVGATVHPGKLDLAQASLSRAAELAMVSYDSNAESSQYLQGWLMHDNFMLRDTFGAPYEFLWANPYQPGLSFTDVPLVFHDAEFGKLFVRSDWEDSADWFGYFDGVSQYFHDGQLSQVSLASVGSIDLGTAVIHSGPAARFEVNLRDPHQAVILVGLVPLRVYQVEIDDEEVSEQASDAGGILVLQVPPGKPVGVRIREARASQ